MKYSLSLPISLLLALQPSSAQEWNSTCREGVGPCVGPEVVALETSECQQYHIFIARGSDSGYPGHQGPLVHLVCEELEDCGYENIIYPANSTFAGEGMWCRSAHIGATEGQRQIRDYAERCPDANLILTGFSQGASVMLDIIGGGGGTGLGGCQQEYNPPLPRLEEPGSRIVAATVFGAPVRSAHQPYTLETGADFNGQNPRHCDGSEPRSEDSLSFLLEYKDILRDYCNIGDPVCCKDTPAEDISKHLNYFDVYNEEAAHWLASTAAGKQVAGRPQTPSAERPQANGNASRPTVSADQTSEVGGSRGQAAPTQVTQPSGGVSLRIPWGSGVACAVGAILVLLKVV